MDRLGDGSPAAEIPRSRVSLQRFPACNRCRSYLNHSLYIRQVGTDQYAATRIPVTVREDRKTGTTPHYLFRGQASTLHGGLQSRPVVTQRAWSVTGGRPQAPPPDPSVGHPCRSSPSRGSDRDRSTSASAPADRGERPAACCTSSPAGRPTPRLPAVAFLAWVSCCSPRAREPQML